MREEELSYRYARALFELAVRSKINNNIIEELEYFLFCLKEEEKLSVILRHPAVSKNEKFELLENIVGRMKFEPLLIAFLKLLSFRNRFGLINLIYEDLKALNNELIGRQVVFVESAVELKDKDKKKLEDNLSKILKKTVKLETATNPTLLGGLKIEYGDRVHDLSLRKQLHNLKESIL